jgi:hypothetical protein
MFLLSPANITGIRARQIISRSGASNLQRRLRKEGVPLGELFSFMSGLYFRGKLVYSRAFATTPPSLPGAYIITAGAGLITPETPVTLERLHEICGCDVEAENARYRGPLDRDLLTLVETAGAECQFVLLGSIATPKYVDPLLETLGGTLFFPAEFVGRGDMSRGGLLLRCASAGKQLTYVPVATAARHGSRPPRLARGQQYGGKGDVPEV